MITKPLLAATIVDIEELKFPVLVTPKLDGIRVLKVDGKVLTRKFKDLPNNDVRRKLEFILPNGIDGEIMLRNGNFNQVQSAIMSHDGEPDYIFHAFDYVKDDLNKPYQERIKDLMQWHSNLLLKFIALSKIPAGAVTVDPANFNDKIRLVIPTLVNNLDEFYDFETKVLQEGFEGVIIRSVDGRYKCGRSTLKEGILCKFKRVIGADGKKIVRDEEGTVIGFKEKMRNENPQERDAFGNAKRSSKKEGLVPAGTLGALTVKSPDGVVFGLGSGFNDELKQEIWDNQSKYLGKLVKYKYQEKGPNGAPIFPVFLGFRSPDDL